jgi:hypothetical protein
VTLGKTWFSPLSEFVAFSRVSSAERSMLFGDLDSAWPNRGAFSGRTPTQAETRLEKSPGPTATLRGLGVTDAVVTRAPGEREVRTGAGGSQGPGNGLSESQRLENSIFLVRPKLESSSITALVESLRTRLEARGPEGMSCATVSANRRSRREYVRPAVRAVHGSVQEGTWDDRAGARVPRATRVCV